MYTSTVAAPPYQERLFTRRLGVEQRETLRRLTGRWLLEEIDGRAYWCTERGRRVPPYRCLRRDLYESLRAHGYLQPVAVRAGRRYYTISAAGTEDMRA